MIKYTLQCSNAHRFESWFKDSAAYEALEAAGHLACPECGDAQVRRAIMAPAVGKKGNQQPAPVARQQVLPPQAAAAVPQDAKMKMLIKAMRAHIEANFDNVGKDFPEEVRKIHHGEAEERGIYGEASAADAESLWEDGIPVLPIPKVDDDA